MLRKQTILLLASFTLLSATIVAQGKSDSLLTQIEHSNNWDEKALLTYEFCKLNLGSNPDKCLELYDIIEKNEGKLTDYTQLFNLYNVKGIIYQFRHNVDSSNIYLTKAFDLAIEKQDSLLLIKSISNLSINYRNEGDYQKAIEYSLISLKYLKAHKDTINWANSLTEIGNSYIYLENYKEGMLYQRQALHLFDSKGYVKGVGNVYHSIAYVKKDLDQLDSAVYYIELSIEAHEESGDIFSMMSAKRSLCTYYSDLGRTKQEQFDCVSELLEIDKSLKNQEGMMLDYLNMSRILNNQDKFIEATKLNKKALKIAKELDDKRVMYECYTSLAIKMKNTDQADAAYLYLDSAHTLHKELMHVDIQNAVLEADKKFQVAEKEKEIFKVNEEKALLDLKVAKRNNQLFLLSGGVLFILFLGGFIFYRTKQNQKNKLAQIRIEAQQKSLTAVIQAQEEERKRIAKDLHDGIVQQIGGIKLALEKVFSKNKTAESNKILTVLDNSAQELRELSHKMMPRALEEFGLIPALEDMLENSLGNTDIKFEFEHFGIMDRLKENIEIAIYRIAQELINNVIKHSRANKVNIQLLVAGESVILIVEDNGRGMGDSGDKKGIGLMNISSRLDTVNGKVNIEPSPSSGTLATIKIPMK